MPSARVKATLGAALGLLAMAVAACTPEPTKPAVLAPGDYRFVETYLSWLIPREMAKHDVAGLSIALVDDRRIVWSRGFGYADVERRVPASAHTVYRAASVSKLLTATAIMQLAESGRIDIDAPVQRYIPEFSVKTRFPEGGPITVRNLMTHHSGLPTFLFKDFWRGVPLAHLLTQLKDEYVAFPPDYVACYSNVGYDLLGLLIERVSGRAYRDHMDSVLLRPLGMEHASFGVPTELGPLLAQGYRNGERFQEPTHARDIPAGGLHASVLDLSRFVQMVLGGGRANGQRLVRPETLREMLRPQNTQVVLDLDQRVGLGWGLGNRQLDYAGPVASHSGATVSFRSRVTILPEDGLGVVVLSNSSDANPVIGKAVVTALQLALEAKRGITPQGKAAPPAAKRAVAVPAEVVERFAGSYATGIGLVRVSDIGGQLRAALDGMRVHLIPVARDRFRAEYRLFGLVPLSPGDRWRETEFSRVDIEGVQALVETRGGRRRLLGVRLAAAPIPDGWRRRLGRYDVINQDSGDMQLLESRLDVVSGLLTLSYRVPDAFGDLRVRRPLTVIDDDLAVLAGLGTGLGEGLQAVRVDGQEQLRYSGFLLRRSNP